jgi:hypothetical protein
LWYFDATSTLELNHFLVGVQILIHGFFLISEKIKENALIYLPLKRKKENNLEKSI